MIAMNEGPESYRRVLQTELTDLARVRIFADLDRWRCRLVAELFDPTSSHSRALEHALNKKAQPTDSPETADQASAFLDEWSAILVSTLRRLQHDKIISAEQDPDNLATLTMAAICGGALIATISGDRGELIKALDMALHQIGSPTRS